MGAGEGLGIETVEERLQFLQLAVDGAGDAISISRLDEGQPDRLVYVNDSFCRLTGYSREDLLGQSLEILSGSKWDGIALGELVKSLRKGEPYRGELMGYRKDGSAYYQETSCTPVFGSSSAVSHFVAISRDVTDRRRAHDLLAHQALHDALTDLPNRILLGDRLRQAILAANRDNRELAVMMLDLDGFKEVNDSHGHRIGDMLLRQLGPRLQAAVRESDTVARVGGDEFAVVLPAAGPSRDVELIGHKLLAAVRRPFDVAGKQLSISGSIGAALYPPHGGDAETLLEHADQAMYTAKRLALGCALYGTRAV